MVAMTEQAKSRRLRKCEIVFIVKQLEKVNLEVMEAFVTKQVDETQVHLTCYSARLSLWEHLKEVGFGKLLKHFPNSFCKLFLEYTKGGECFARLLAAWYQGNWLCNMPGFGNPHH